MAGNHSIYKLNEPTKFNWNFKLKDAIKWDCFLKIIRNSGMEDIH